MEVTRCSDWEQKEGIIKAYQHGVGVYYIAKDDEYGPGYRLAYWPDKRKDIETVSLLESFETEDEACDGLEDKIAEIRS